MQYFTVDEDSIGLRLDQFLAKKLNLNREKIKEIFSHNIEYSVFLINDLKKLFQLNIINTIENYSNKDNVTFLDIQNLKNSLIFSKKVLKLSQKVNFEESFAIKISNTFNSKITRDDKKDLSSYNFKDWIIFEDEYLLIINKQPGILTHNKPGSHQDITLVDLMRDYLGINFHNKEVGENDRQFIVHRLDRETSGLMILAKTHETYQLLVEMFKNKLICKKYLGLVLGKPNPVCGLIKEYLGRDKNNRMKMHVCIPKVLKYYPDAKEGITHYFLKESFYNHKVNLIEFILETGRTHQIRAHMDFIGHPILGDKVYGVDKNRNFFNTSEVTRHMLHSYFLDFIHPIDNKKMTFTIEISDDMKNLISNLKSILI